MGEANPFHLISQSMQEIKKTPNGCAPMPCHAVSLKWYKGIFFFCPIVSMSCHPVDEDGFEK